MTDQPTRYPATEAGRAAAHAEAERRLGLYASAPTGRGSADDQAHAASFNPMDVPARAFLDEGNADADDNGLTPAEVHHAGDANTTPGQWAQYDDRGLEPHTHIHNALLNRAPVVHELHSCTVADYEEEGWREFHARQRLADEDAAVADDQIADEDVMG